MKHLGTVRLETENLILRPFTLEDAHDLYTNWASDDEVTKYLTWPTYGSLEDAKGRLDYLTGIYGDPNVYEWCIESKTNHEAIGSIAVVSLDESVSQAELGWCLGRKYWGQGIMPEAAKEVIRFLFEEVGVERICARHDVNNPKSGRVMRKVSMSYEGTLRQSARNNQGIVDLAVYSILKSEYKKMC